MATECAHEVVPMDEMDSPLPKSDSIDSAGLRLGAANRTEHFTYDVKELRQLMEYRGREAVAHIRDRYGTISNICRDLWTSENEG